MAEVNDVSLPARVSTARYIVVFGISCWRTDWDIAWLPMASNRAPAAGDVIGFRALYFVPNSSNILYTNWEGMVTTGEMSGRTPVETGNTTLAADSVPPKPVGLIEAVGIPIMLNAPTVRWSRKPAPGRAKYWLPLEVLLL